AGRSDVGGEHVDDVHEAAAKLPDLGRAGSLIIAPGSGSSSKVPRKPHRYSGRTAMNAQVNIHEPKTTTDMETPLAFSMEGQFQDQSSALLPFVWAPGWNSNQSLFKFQQEVGGELVGGDPGIRLFNGDRSGAYPARSGSGSEGAGGNGSSFRLLPAASIFGSDELSHRSPPVAERSAPAFMVFNPDDAARLELAEGAGVSCGALDASFVVRLDPAIKSGHAAVSVGLPGAEGELPTGPVVLVADSEYRPPVPTNVIARG
ncbi:MAG: hypothetical protein ACC642_08260, partial [Pseudomonadales bacterium]